MDNLVNEIFYMFNNEYHILVVEGVSIKPSRALLGNTGLVKIDGINLKRQGLTDGFRLDFTSCVCGSGKVVY